MLTAEKAAVRRQRTRMRGFQNQIFNAFHFTPLSDVKVLLLGQDPYHNEHQAHGMSFSVLPDQKDIPPSLQNIYQELHDDLGCYIPNNGYLKKWADQGVLLLNTDADSGLGCGAFRIRCFGLVSMGILLCAGRPHNRYTIGRSCAFTAWMTASVNSSHPFP